VAAPDSCRREAEEGKPWALGEAKVEGLWGPSRMRLDHFEAAGKQANWFQRGCGGRALWVRRCGGQGHGKAFD
jgi:hypothetical protein